MRKKPLFVALGVIVPIIIADTFTLSLGKIDQYTASITETPTMTGARIMFTNPASPKNGINIIISDGLRTNIEQAVDSSCGQIDDHCIETVKSVLISPHTELESRAAGMVVAVSALMGMVSAFYAVWIKERPRPIPIALNIPGPQVTQASSAATASIIAIVTESGTPFVTMTPSPVKATVTGSQTPVATTFTTTANGHSRGDVVIDLSQDLADRVTELLRRTGECPAGDSFKSNKLRKRLDDYGAVVCGAEQVLMNAAPGAAFGDLVMLRANPFPWTAEDAVRAMGAVMQFARERAPDMGVDPATAGAIGAGAFALAWVVLINNQPLGTQNTIPENKLEGTIMPSATPSPTSVTSTTSSSSSSSGECLASCFMTGAIKRCETQCPNPTAATDEKRVRTVTIEPWVVPPMDEQIPMQGPVVACLPDKPVTFSHETFNETRDSFCKEADITWDEVSWVVDGAGKRINSKARRALDADPILPRDEVSSVNATFWWRPAADAGFACYLSCGEALDQIAYSDCKPKDEEDSANIMAAGGGVDLGCGTYSFSVFNTTSIKEATIICRNHPLSAPQHDADADGGTSVESAIDQWCSDNDGKAVDKQQGTDNIYQRYGITQLGVPDRSSFWLRAALTCSESEKMVKDECKKALLDGMAKCDANSAVTHGHAASVGCLDYSIDLSGVTKDDSPPWDEKHGFPPPEFIAGKGMGGGANYPKCYQSYEQPPDPGRPITEDDLNKAIDAYCHDGDEIPGFGEKLENFFDYPPEGTTTILSR